MRYAALPGLFFIVLFAALTCTTTEVKNATSEPVFVNLASRDASHDYAGYLLQPGASRSFANYGESLRVRNLAGETILFARGTSTTADDASYDVSSLAPDPIAPAVGHTFVPGLGYNTRSSAIICDDGSEQQAPLFGTLVTVKNASDRTLVLSLYERFADTGERLEATGALAPAGETVQVYGKALFEPWLRAFDANGSLVYVAPLRLEERQTIEIPPEILPTPQDIPAQEVHRGISACRTWANWIVIGGIVLLLLAIVLAFALLWMSMALLSVVLATPVLILTVVVELVT